MSKKKKVSKSDKKRVERVAKKRVKRVAKKKGKKTVKRRLKAFRPKAAEQDTTVYMVDGQEVRRVKHSKKTAKKRAKKKATRRRFVPKPAAFDTTVYMVEGKESRRVKHHAKKRGAKKSKTVTPKKGKTRERTVSAAEILKGAKRGSSAVAYICAGPRYTGCGGGKKGSHVKAHISSSLMKALS